MSEFFTVSVMMATLASGIRLATPFLLAAIGETFSQRSGVLNLGVEGVMLLGAYGAYYTTLQTGSTATALAVALLIGIVMGVVYAIVTLYAHAIQGISGIGVFLFGSGLTALLFGEQVGSPWPIDGLPRVEIPLLSDLPWIGEVLFDHNVLVYFAFICVPLASFIIRKTTFGLNLRAVGETPEAADSLGVSVNLTRFWAILIGNSCAALAGAALVMELDVFRPGFTAGQGFIAVSLVYFGAWRPSAVMGGALLFGVVSASVLQLKALGVVTGAASTLTAMGPPLLTIIVLVLVSRRIGTPAALTKPFQRAG